MELRINSPKDPDSSIAAASSMFPIQGVVETQNDAKGPDYKELAESIRSVFSDASLPNDFKTSVLKGLSALMGRQITTSDSFAQMIENLESLNVRDEENREKASKGATFIPFEKTSPSIGERVTKSPKPNTKTYPESTNKFSSSGSDEGGFERDLDTQEDLL